MMISSIRSLAYLAASLLFILSLRGLSTQESAQRGNRYGIIGMLVAVIITAAALLLPADITDMSSMPHPDLTVVGVLIAALALGGWVGAALAGRVAMTSMPELVAILHSFVGAAAAPVPAPKAHGHGAGAPMSARATVIMFAIGAIVFGLIDV